MVYHIIPLGGKNAQEPHVASFTTATLYATYRIGGRTYWETRAAYQDYTDELENIN